MERSAARRHKMERLARGEVPRVLDLFSGCGGISLGFLRAGYRILGNVEIDPQAAATYALNFFAGDERYRYPRDIASVEPDVLIREMCGESEPVVAVDVIVGGPPCQAYSRIGRAKLREVRRHPEAFRLDPRGNLYLRYLHYVERLQPLALVMENVPDVLDYGGVNIPEEICETLEELGYVCRYTLLNAVHYGVPQLRERLFLIALARELEVEPEFPEPTHWMELPEGYQQIRGGLSRKLPSVNQLSLFRNNYFVVPPQPSASLPRFVSVQEAIGDLPPIQGPTDRRACRSEPLPYPAGVVLSDYAREMRTWPGFEAGETVTHHVTRCLPRDYPIFRRMAWGDQYPEAHRKALELLHEKLAELGVEPIPGTPVYEEWKARIVPPYDPNKFPNKWRKMEPDMPARTLMAHLSKDGYSHIHYDHEQARTITVREAARLQSFPDGFRFVGGMNAAFRMIGNAVPPLLAYRIGEKLLSVIRRGLHATTRS